MTWKEYDRESEIASSTFTETLFFTVKRNDAWESFVFFFDDFKKKTVDYATRRKLCSVFKGFSRTIAALIDKQDELVQQMVKSQCVKKADFCPKLQIVENSLKYGFLEIEFCLQ